MSAEEKTTGTELEAVEEVASTEPQTQIHTRNLGFIQRDFINPKNIGFMKVILFLFGINIVFNCVGMAVITKDTYQFDFGHVLNLLNVIFEAVSFWLIWRRKKVARWWVIGFAAFNIIVGSIYNYTNGQFFWVTQILYSSFDILLILYFLIAKRVKICLDQPFSLATYKREDEEDRDCFKPKTWPFWRNLIMYFCVFSIVGHWMEAGYCTLIRFGLIPGTYDPNSGIWHDPLSPFMVYGVGMVACVLIFYPIKLWLQGKFKKGWKGNFAAVFITFVIAGIVCCLIELAMGLMMNTHYELWDYRDMFCNFMGQVCLQNGVAFGMVATLMTWIIYPALERAMSHVPREMGNGLMIAVVVFFMLVYLLYCFTVPQDAQSENVDQSQSAVEQTADGYSFEGMTAEQVLQLADDKSLEAQGYASVSASFASSGDTKQAEEFAQYASEASQHAHAALEHYSSMLATAQ